MDTQTLLLTGATGLIGFQILLDALKSGLTIRVVVRSAVKGAQLLQHPHVNQAAQADLLSFITIPNFASPDAWDVALRGIKFVIHVASPLPLPFLDPQEDIFKPIIEGNTSLLQAALKFPTLKRIILTSSIVATMPLPPRDRRTYNAETRYPMSSGPFTNVYDAYQAAKGQVLQMSHDIVSKHHPSFDVINVFPGYTFGRNARAKKTSDMFTSSNGLLLGLLRGRKFPGARTAGAAHLEDVSQVHIKALGSDIPGNKDYGVTIPMEYDAAIQIAKREFPDAFKNNVFNENGSQPSESVDWNAQSTEELFSIKFRSYETMVTDVVAQYMDLLEQENGVE